MSEPFEATIHDSLGIRTVEAGPERVVLEMDVGPRVHQPLGLLHGGASATLAESAASIGAYLASADDETSMGTDLNISHLRAKREGLVRAVAVPVRKGRSIHVWSVDIVDEEGTLVAVARCTLAIRRLGERG
ncbi:MAG TPA: PaaI family thioesterase [Actinomycetota bacterium]|nr:PaaI family thioesterase [Actinomycetota bacterium]